jgi:DNA-binding MarR family transcriptional regulator/N-acetylglutamate synthase-like GNAT family acetyltransferase
VDVAGRAGDIISERGLLFLGSRLKRLAERMQGDVAQIVDRAGLPVQPTQYAFLATLDDYGPLTVGELADSMQISQPAVTRTMSGLVAMGLVEVSHRHRDQRHKTISLTAAGASLLTRSKLVVWPQVEAAVTGTLEGISGSLLEQITAIEARLAENPIHRRAQPKAPALSICDFVDELAGAFRDINCQWIEAMYRLESADLDVLNHPRERIIDPGGAVLFVQAEGVGVIGCCGLKKTGERQFELTKMGVLEAARGLKAGEFLLKAAIARAQFMGAELLYLLSNRKSVAAVHLYEKLGFVHDTDIMRRFGAAYERCDVAMRYRPL